jgi:hypothetical protein
VLTYPKQISYLMSDLCLDVLQQDLRRMDKQRELSLRVANNSLQEVQEPEPMKVAKQILKHIEQQTPIVWYGGGEGECHDVTINLIPNAINRNPSEDTEHHREILAVLKVHSSRLRKCSKYYETCLTERWTNPSSTSSSEFFLEAQTAIECYTDCFSRMYSSPFYKDFKDVKYSLELLNVSSQIQFQQLMDSILLYLSSKAWLDTDAAMIRLYSASPDFPRKHAQDLIVRLGMDESKEECHKQLCAVVEQSIQTALGHDGNFRFHRTIIKEMLPDSNGASADSIVTRDVVRIVSAETKNMLVAIGKECDGQTYLSVPRFADKISAICWILEALLAAKVAEEVVECFVHLHAFPRVLAIDSPRAMNYGYENHAHYQESTKVQRVAREAAMELAKLVVVMYREVAAGNLLLKTPERVALWENWHSLLGKFSNKDTLDQVTKDLFSTLPVKNQMELVKSRKDSNFEDYINKNSFAKLLKGMWPAGEVEYVVPPPPSCSQAE